MKFRTMLTAAAAAFSLALAPASSKADALLGVTLFGGQLISVDTTTGLGSLVGPLGTGITPYGLSSYKNSLYTYDAAGGNLVQVNALTGATVKTVNVGVGPVVGQGGLAINASGLGFLTSAFGGVSQVPTLYEFNVITGTQTAAFNLSSTIEALALSANGTLFALGKFDGQLYTVNQANGVLTDVGSVGVDQGSLTGGLTFAPNGTLYGTFDDGLYTINTATGAATPVVNDPFGPYTGFDSISGLAPLVTSVPEPGSIALAGAGLALAAVFQWRARRRAA